ncbi:unnamed protein product [Pedinophyceae sp. YPF-701]|nr:unnamed protein product [Pedinophyceae sp. YPF-701]
MHAREMAMHARDQGRILAGLPTEKRQAILNRVADALLANEDAIRAENNKDVEAARGKISDSLLQRLVLKDGKIQQLAEGIRAIARQDEPLHRVIKRTEIAEGLILEQKTSPIGVLLIIFEARPDAMPQIAALAISSGNGLLLKGGKEATLSNAIIHKVITDALKPDVDPSLIGLVTSRDEISDLLSLDDVIDLVIPRGSNALVSHIQNNTKIPVLGHADGVCHIFVDKDVDIDLACKLVVDSKTDYPAACNAVETVLFHKDLVASGAAAKVVAALQEAGVKVHGATEEQKAALGLDSVAPDPHHEYSSLDVSAAVVPEMPEAIDWIHKYGSGHTEAILTKDKAKVEEFVRKVDSACVFANTSTRFSDGFRFGLGAEVGISTSRIHARGPVGVEGLLTTRWVMCGNGEYVAKDTGVKYTHKKLPVPQ